MRIQIDNAMILSHLLSFEQSNSQNDVYLYGITQYQMSRYFLNELFWPVDCSQAQFIRANPLKNQNILILTEAGLAIEYRYDLVADRLQLDSALGLHKPIQMKLIRKIFMPALNHCRQGFP